VGHPVAFIELKGVLAVLWKRLNTETSQRGNASKTGFEEFPFFFGKSLKTGKC